MEGLWPFCRNVGESYSDVSSNLIWNGVVRHTVAAVPYLVIFKDSRHNIVDYGAHAGGWYSRIVETLIDVLLILSSREGSLRERAN